VAAERSSSRNTEPLVNLNARIPKKLWRRVRLQCLQEERLLRTFITEALREHLREQTARSQRRA
jgi:predicted HicB family RNase H-like nuclease